MVASLQDDLEVGLLDPDTPDDILAFYVDEGNEKAQTPKAQLQRQPYPALGASGIP